MLNDDIIKIIRQGVNDQKLLLEKLSDLGHHLTQSSISRKLKQIGIIKANGIYQMAASEDKKIKSMNFVEPNLFIIRTAPGHAGAIASIIDKQLVDKPRYPSFVGTIAGDDTIFIAIKDCKNFDEVKNILKEIITAP